MDNNGGPVSSDQDELLCVHIVACLNTVKVDPAWKIRQIDADAMDTCRFFFLDERRDALPEDIEDAEVTNAADGKSYRTVVLGLKGLG